MIRLARQKFDPYAGIKDGIEIGGNELGDSAKIELEIQGGRNEFWRGGSGLLVEPGA